MDMRNQNHRARSSEMIVFAANAATSVVASASCATSPKNVSRNDGGATIATRAYTPAIAHGNPDSNLFIYGCCDLTQSSREGRPGDPLADLACRGEGPWVR